MVKTENFILRYANCWEDAGLLVRQVQKSSPKRILSVCSGGDNSLSLLTTSAEEVVVVDINPLQLYLLELKIAAIKAFEYEKALQFLGFLPGENRLEDFQKLKPYLSPEANLYWLNHIKMLKHGIVISARLERNLRFFARFYRPLIHSRKNVDLLLSKKSGTAQKEFYERTWNSFRWRALFRIFFSNTVLKFIAPDPDFFNYVNEDVGQYLLKKTARHFSSTICQENPFLHYALKGSFKDCLPHAWQEENYNLIKMNLPKLKMLKGFAEDAFKDGGKFDAFNLSNIFEYTTKEEFRAMAEALSAGANAGARFFYWNILLPRKLSDALPKKIQNKMDSSKDDEVDDFGWIYQRFVIDEYKQA